MHNAQVSEGHSWVGRLGFPLLLWESL